MISIDPTVVYIIIDDGASFRDLEQYACHISPRRREQIGRYVREEDKLTSLAAELLVRRETGRALRTTPGEVALARQASGKLYLPDYPGYHFSISHSGRCVAFAHSSAPVGVDAEQISDPDWAAAELCFAPGELDFLRRSGPKSGMFYKIWTPKEAYVKMLGAGMSMPLPSFDVADKSLAGSFRSRRCSNYWISVCSRTLETNRGVCPFARLTLTELLRGFP